MIAGCRRHLALVWFCLLLAALPRALLPAGTMPEFGDGGIQLSFCVSDDGGRLLKQLGDSSPQPSSHGSCPYALAQSVALAGSAPVGPAMRYASAPLPPALRPQPRYVQHPPRPPSQAPPTRIESLG